MENLAPHLAKGCKAILLANHGNVVVGPDIMRVFFDMEKLEMLAKTLYIAKQIGTPRRLTDEEIGELKRGLHR
jgi:L-fuculose-phosphate aldolase